MKVYVMMYEEMLMKERILEKKRCDVKVKAEIEQKVLTPIGRGLISINEKSVVATFTQADPDASFLVSAEKMAI